MALDRRAREAMLAHCNEIHEDDGVDPREFFREGRNSKKQDRKAKQLCRQVAETLDQVLAGETGDDLLRELRVVQVVPAPDSSRLLVTVAVSPGVQCDTRQVKQRLGQISGYLRTAVAAAITRRKAPRLCFALAGPSADKSPSDEVQR